MARHREVQDRHRGQQSTRREQLAEQAARGFDPFGPLPTDRAHRSVRSVSLAKQPSRPAHAGDASHRLSVGSPT